MESKTIKKGDGNSDRQHGNKTYYKIFKLLGYSWDSFVGRSEKIEKMLYRDA